MENEPLVSIGVPVYNDAPWLRNALDHIVNQDYKNLEIILADDGSIDGSREICHEYAQHDARIRYFENKHNLGAFENHQFVKQVSSGDFFAWGSGHDYLHPSYVSQTLGVLQENSTVVQSFSQSVFLDKNGQITRTTKKGLDTRGLPPVERFRSLFSFLTSGGTGNVFYGLYRSEILAKLQLRREIGYDIILLGELSLLGDIKQVNDVLYYRIIHSDSENMGRTQRHISFIVMGNNFNEMRLMPNVNLFYRLLEVIDNSNLSMVDKECLLADVINNKIMYKRRELIGKEIDQFIKLAIIEMASLINYSQTKCYRAKQILYALEKAQLLGSDSKELKRLKSLCLVESCQTPFNDDINDNILKILLNWVKRILGK